MHIKTTICFCLMIGLIFGVSLRVNAADTAAVEEQPVKKAHDDPFAQDPFSDETDAGAASDQQFSDPIQGYNRFMFAVNDKVYDYALTPTAKGLAFVLPEPSRVCIKNFFYNISMPIRAINCLFQGRGPDVGVELWRFVINSTAGIGGLFDPASSFFYLPTYKEDTGLTLGNYGAGPGFYFVLPLLGPSSGRDSIGRLCDVLMDPVTHLMFVGARSIDIVNDTSFDPDEYGNIKAASLDPYVAIRNGYLQNRAAAIQK